MQHQETKDAGLIVVLNVMRIDNEPTASAIVCGLEWGRVVGGTS